MQALSLGLGDRWEKVKDAYAHANRALGDIVKVTPSSKVSRPVPQSHACVPVHETACLSMKYTSSRSAQRNSSRFRCTAL